MFCRKMKLKHLCKLFNILVSYKFGFEELCTKCLQSKGHWTGWGRGNLKLRNSHDVCVMAYYLYSAIRVHGCVQRTMHRKGPCSKGLII